jgi:hypothetical protein
MFLPSPEKFELRAFSICQTTAEVKNPPDDWLAKQKAILKKSDDCQSLGGARARKNPRTISALGPNQSIEIEQR